MFRRLARFLLGIVLVAAPCIPAYAAEIPVEGVVRGAEGIGIPSARVELRPVVSRYQAGLAELEGRVEPAPAAKAATDRTGRFRLSVPQAGLWRLVAVADGFVPMEISALPAGRRPACRRSLCGSTSACECESSTRTGSQCLEPRCSGRLGSRRGGALTGSRSSGWR
jgi:hypothetical protein